MVGWFDKTFDARGENSRLKDELVETRRLAVGAQAALQENEQFRKLFKLDRESAIAASDYRPVTGRVIARTPTVWHSAATIHLRSCRRLHGDGPGLSGEGLVGC